MYTIIFQSQDLIEKVNEVLSLSLVDSCQAADASVSFALSVSTYASFMLNLPLLVLFLYTVTLKDAPKKTTTIPFSAKPNIIVSPLFRQRNSISTLDLPENNPVSHSYYSEVITFREEKESEIIPQKTIKDEIEEEDGEEGKEEDVEDGKEEENLQDDHTGGLIRMNGFRAAVSIRSPAPRSSVLTTRKALKTFFYKR